MLREDYCNRMYDLFVALYKNVRFSRPGWSIELDEKNTCFVAKYTMGDKMYVATVKPKIYRIGMSINVYRHEKDGMELWLCGRTLPKEKCVFDIILEEADVIAEAIENDMLCCFTSRVLRPAIDNMQVSFWEMNYWKEVADNAIQENIEREEANEEVSE